MFTAIILIAAFWLVVAPSVLGFGTAATLGSVLSGVLAAVVVLRRRWGENRFFWIALLGLYNLVVGFLFGGPTRWSAVGAGAVLAVAGMLSLRGDQGSSLERPA